MPKVKNLRFTIFRRKEIEKKNLHFVVEFLMDFQGFDVKTYLLRWKEVHLRMSACMSILKIKIK